MRRAGAGDKAAMFASPNLSSPPAMVSDCINPRLAEQVSHQYPFLLFLF